MTARGDPMAVRTDGTEPYVALRRELQSALCLSLEEKCAVVKRGSGKKCGISAGTPDLRCRISYDDFRRANPKNAAVIGIPADRPALDTLAPVRPQVAITFAETERNPSAR